MVKHLNPAMFVEAARNVCFTSVGLHLERLIESYLVAQRVAHKKSFNEFPVQACAVSQTQLHIFATYRSHAIFPCALLRRRAKHDDGVRRVGFGAALHLLRFAERLGGSFGRIWLAIDWFAGVRLSSYVSSYGGHEHLLYVLVLFTIEQTFLEWSNKTSPYCVLGSSEYRIYMITFYIVLGLLAVLVLWAIVAYNGFVRMVMRAKEAWADIDVQLKRRYDLIPNLIESVKGYVTHEKDTLEKVTAARTAAMDAGGVEAKAQAENMLTGALKSLFAVAESYPDLKANTNFLELQRELSDTENKIQAARRFYNTNVRDLNTAIESFPGNIIAGIFRFEPREFFELGENEAAAREPVKVSF